MTATVSYDQSAFALLQDQLREQWGTMIFGLADGLPTTIVVVASDSLYLPSRFAPVVPAYEERYLFVLLLLARSRQTRVVYVTSSPMPPRLVDYFFGLIPGHDHDELRKRLTVVSLSDSSFRPLSQKILERPRVIARLRSLVGPARRGLLVPFITSELEARLALELGIPVYGPDPSLAHLGTKTGSREVFAAAGIDIATGVEGLRGVDDLREALAEIAQRTQTERVIVKIDDGVSGMGNAVMRLPGESKLDVEELTQLLELEDRSQSRESFLERFDANGGVVEEFLTGSTVRSPSVQLRISPWGEVAVLSTHDQILGGPLGQTYLGCRFPAAMEYSRDLVEPSLAVGRQLAGQGVVGPSSIDYVSTQRDDGTWRNCAVEINLRNSGTTHPALTLQALTDAPFNAETGELVSRGRAKHYLATDHLEHPRFASLTPDDLLDVIEGDGLGWDDETHTGIAFHLASAIAIGGQVGLTAIGDSDRQAQQLYDSAKDALIAATAN
jgi:hypothetical protein